MHLCRASKADAALLRIERKIAEVHLARSRQVAFECIPVKWFYKKLIQ